MSPAIEPIFSNCFLAEDVFEIKTTLFRFFMEEVMEVPSEDCLVRNWEYSEPSRATMSALSTDSAQASTSILLACDSSSGDGWPKPWLWRAVIMVPSDLIETPVATQSSRP